MDTGINWSDVIYHLEMACDTAKQYAIANADNLDAWANGDDVMTRVRAILDSYQA